MAASPAFVEAWLDSHPHFFKDYLLRKASRHVIDAWLIAHANEERDAETADNASSSNNSGSTTPVRKISAHEFERGHLNRPIVATADGTPSFLISNTTGNLSTAPSQISCQSRKRSRQMSGLNESELILELVRDIYDDLDVRRLCLKILQNVGLLTKADRCSLFLVQPEEGESLCLVSDLFDVSPQSTIEEMEGKREIRVPWGHGIVGFVAQQGAALNIADCYEDPRFNQEVDAMTGYRTRSMLCTPIKDAQTNEVIGVAQVINKQASLMTTNNAFTAEDEEVFAKYLQFCGIGLRNAQLYERSQLEVKRNQVLLDLASVIFQEQSTMDTLILRILTHMLSLIRCERAALVLRDERSSRVFDLCADDIRDDKEVRAPFENRCSLDQSTVDRVAATGATVNIVRNADNTSKEEVRTLLCMPIRHASSAHQTLGVFVLTNKFEGLAFTRNDENFVEAFALFCGMGLKNVQNYETAILAMAKQQVTLEVLNYHAMAGIEEAMTLAKCPLPEAKVLRLNKFDFDDFSLDDHTTMLASLRMFVDLGLASRFRMEYATLCRWLASIRKNYRNVVYHNFRHAFNVAQVMFAILTNTSLGKQLGEIEMLSLLIACLCHDLDHRGTNNTFQKLSSSSLAQLYSTSTMEHHHFDQCLMILNSKGNQILARLTQGEFRRVVSTLEDAILATDVAVFFRRRSSTFSLLHSPDFSLNNLDVEEQSLIRGLLMTGCDLAAITKPFSVQKKVARLVSSEFFYQGDLERSQFKLTPSDMMNREKIDLLPALQVDFIDSVCLPVYQALVLVNSDLGVLLEGCRRNRQEWQKRARRQQHKEDTNNNNNSK